MKKILFLCAVLSTNLGFAQNLKIVEINHQGNEVCLEIENLENTPQDFRVLPRDSSGNACVTCTLSQPNFNIGANEIMSISVGNTFDTNLGFLLAKLQISPTLPACNDINDCWVSINGSIPSNFDEFEDDSVNAGNETTAPNLSVQFVNNNGTNQWTENLSASCGTPNIPLPVELVNFTARAINNDQHVQLEWRTQTESQNKGFYIQKYDINTKVYYDIAFVRSQSESGTSNTALDYSYIDPFPESGINYYRLKQEDLDGSMFYSIIRSVDIEDGGTDFKVYPNPTAGHITVDNLSDQNVIYNYVSIFSYDGKLLRQWKDHENNQYDLSNLNNGIYFIRLDKDRQHQIIKIVVEK